MCFNFNVVSPPQALASVLYGTSLFPRTQSIHEVQGSSGFVSTSAAVPARQPYSERRSIDSDRSHPLKARFCTLSEHSTAITRFERPARCPCSVTLPEFPDPPGSPGMKWLTPHAHRTPFALVLEWSHFDVRARQRSNKFHATGRRPCHVSFGSGLGRQNASFESPPSLLPTTHFRPDQDLPERIRADPNHRRIRPSICE